MKTLKKTASVLLAGLICAQIAVPSFAADTDDNQCTGQILVAVNTNYDDSDASWFTTADGGEQPETESKENVSECTCDVINNVEIMTPEQAAAAAKKDTGKTSPDDAGESYKVGDVKTIHTSVSSAGISQATEECIFVGDYCTVWCIVDVITGSVTEENREKYISLAEEAESIIPKELDLLGDVRLDTDKDGKIAIFIFGMTNAGGYFSKNSLVDKNGKIGDIYVGDNDSSDHIDCINVNTNLPYYYQIHTVAHEYQHYINQCYCYYGKTNDDYMCDMETYLNEGFGDSVGLVLTDFDRRFDPNDYYNRRPYSLTAKNYGKYSYNLGFGFCQYLRTRYAAMTNDTSGNYPGSGIYRKVLEARNSDNDGNTLGIIADMLYPASQYPALKDTDARCRQLIVDFWKACILNEPTGNSGFNSDQWAKDNITFNCTVAANCLPGDEGDSVMPGMASAYIIYKNEKATATITSADDGIVFFAVEDDMTGLTYHYLDGRTKTELGSEFSINSYGTMTPYRFVGWSTDPDAETPEYTYGQSVTFEKSTELWPVFVDDAIKLEIDSEYTISDAGGNDYYFTFTVPETGNYTFCLYDISSFLFVVYDSGELVERICTDYTEYDSETRYVTFHLDAGTEYRVCAASCYEGTISFTKTEAVYTITYDCGGYGYYRYSTIFSAVTADDNFFSEYVNFMGWSTEKGSDTVEYEPGSEITLTGDLVLYAVIEPDVVLSEGSNRVSSPYRHFTFTPKKSGTYSFAFDNGYYHFSIEDCYEFSNNSPETPEVYLEKGKTYRIFFGRYNSETDYDTITISCIREEEKSYILTYCDTSINMVCCTCKGSDEYTIIDVPVYCMDSDELLGWTTDRNYVEGESVLYKEGDTIILSADTILYPVLSSTEGLTQTHLLMNSIMNFFTWLFRFPLFYVRASLGMI